MKTGLPCGGPAGFLRLVVLAWLVFGLVNSARCQDDEDEPPHEPTAAEVEEIKSKAKALLQNVVPGKTSKPDRAITVLETPDGSVRWGKLFETSEISALVNVYTGKSENDWDHAPQYLCYFVWNKGQWIYRQFLGNAYALHLHYWKGSPSIFLQGSRRQGRFHGECFSWYYDAKDHSLKRTHFEDWGPFYLAGNYLICTRGFERRAHDETLWIYAYKDGVKGRLLAIYHWNDSNYFEITLRNSKSGKMEVWYFKSDYDSTVPIRVTCRSGLNERGEFPKEAEIDFTEAEFTLKDLGELPPEYCFQLLTGLNPALLNSELAWLETLPKETPLQRIPIKASGDSKIVKLFQWPPINEKK